MKTIPHRLNGGTGLTYVAHCGVSDAAPYRAAAAFLDERDRWRPYAPAGEHPTPLAAYLAVMRGILDTVATEADKSYVFFYPADPAIAAQLRDAAVARADGLDEPETDDAWRALRDAFAGERCGISVLIQKNGPGTGTLAVLRALAGEEEEPARVEDTSAPEEDPMQPDGPPSPSGASHEDLFG